MCLRTRAIPRMGPGKLLSVVSGNRLRQPLDVRNVADLIQDISGSTLD